MSRVLDWPGQWRMIFAGSGAGDAAPLVAVALAIALAARDGTIERLGPLTFAPSVRVVVVAPALLAVACAISHATASAPVILRCQRVRAARLISYVSVLGAGIAVLGLGASVATTGQFAASLRGLLLLTGLALATAALVGVTYAWVPVVGALGAAVLSSQSGVWTPYAMLVSAHTSGAQVGMSTVVCVLALALAAWDPVCRGYIRPSSRARR